MRGLLELTWMEFKLFIREWQAVFFTFIFLPMLLILFGSIYRNDPSAMFGGAGSVDVMTPGYIAMGIAANAFFTIGGVLTSYRERGILRRFKTTPLSPIAVLGAQIIVAYVMTMLSALLLISLAALFFGIRIPGNPLEIFVAFTIGAISFFSIGFVLGGIFKTARVSYSAGTTLYFPMIFASGAAIPIQIMPDFIKAISHFIPLTYVVNLIKDAWLGTEFEAGGGLAASGVNIAVLAGIFVVCSLLSARIFRWD